MIKKIKILKFIFAGFIAILIFIVLFTKIDPKEVLTVLLSADIKLLIFAVIISVTANIFLATNKWRIILKELGCSILFKESLMIMCGSNPVKFILPFKSGEMIKAIYLQRMGKLSFQYGVISIILDKVLNFLGLLLLLCIGLIFYRIDSFNQSVTASSVFGALFLCSICPQYFSIDKFRGIGAKGYSSIKQMVSALGKISSKQKGKLFLYSMIIQFSGLINAYISFKAVGVTLPFVGILVFIPIVIVLSNIPITIFGLGTREALIVFLFLQYGPQEKLLSAGILYSFIEHILPAGIGLFVLSPFIKKIYK
ncbi:MAG: hypothetical protein DRP78_01980 [Candidatus Omnitrophota bacterium]|nr:MAG: hypothetical protein DRP78_01980 [Candidatus Omnitrophota bacterium]